MFNFSQLLGLAALAAFLLMSAVWAAAVRMRNAGIVDVAWSFCFSILALLYAGLGGGHPVRKALIAGMALFWSVRLGLHLHRRVMGHHPEEDGRYAEIRRRWGARADRNFFFFFQLQALSNVALSAPFLLACLNPDPRLHAAEWAGAALWLAAFLGESAADRQLKRFKADPANRGKICEAGWWRYSRHPNYFFEWLNWVAYFLFALGSPHGWVTVYCPLLMLHFLLNVTGIPLTEEQAVRSKGDAYRKYQRTTSAFVPWFRRAA